MTFEGIMMVHMFLRVQSFGVRWMVVSAALCLEAVRFLGRIRCTIMFEASIMLVCMRPKMLSKIRLGVLNDWDMQLPLRWNECVVEEQ
jgi:hypothetical protein